MIKHVGKHNGKKVAIVYKQVPGEDHMCLVLYTESIPSRVHDEVMKVIESEMGQQAKELADALHRHVMADGNNCLLTIHRAGLMKKVPTIQVVVTPTSTSSVRLDILNDLLTKMEGGEEAIKKLADLDAQRGLGNGLPQGKDLGEATTSASVNPDVVENVAGVLTDADIAKQRLEQAAKMKADATNLLAEAKRLEQEAKALTPKKSNARTTKNTA